MMAVVLIAGIVLLGVILIIGILAAIAIPNFLEAQTRSKVSRVRSDMRSLATAIEAYYIDNNDYPPSTLDPTKAFRSLQSDGRRIPSFQITNPEYGGAILTTPIAYITWIPPDPFGDGEQIFGYHRAGDQRNQGWILFSRGPDGDFDLGWDAYDPSNPESILILNKMYTYDPTNGTVSNGDIWRVKM
jgi:type II secretory pathway pseudopilin PulG